MWFWLEIPGLCPHIKGTWWPFPLASYSVLTIITVVAEENRSLSNLQNGCNPLSSQSVAVLCILASLFTRFVVECVQTARKGFEPELWMATEPLLLMGRNLEETSGRMISNRNPHSRHTSAGPWGDLSICSKVSIGNSSAASEAVLLSSSYLKSSTWCSIIHDFHGALIRLPIFWSRV